MNIFWLDDNLEKCARAYYDKHVVKIITEIAQVLSIANRRLGLQEGFAPISQKTIVDWVCESYANWEKTFQMAVELNKEFMYRYGSDFHKSYNVIYELTKPKELLPDVEETQPPQLMPDHFKRDNVIDAYRTYYCAEPRFGGKRHLANWTRREKPDWWE